jgi:hypothetical protein
MAVSKDRIEDFFSAVTELVPHPAKLTSVIGMVFNAGEGSKALR